MGIEANIAKYTRTSRQSNKLQGNSERHVEYRSNFRPIGVVNVANGPIRVIGIGYILIRQERMASLHIA